MHKESKSFLCAFRGIYDCIISERHFRFDLVVAAAIIYFAARFFTLDSTKWAILSIVIALVLSCEAFNTAIEKLCDKVTDEYSEKIKFVKDVSAGAVLISAIIAVVIAFLLLFDIPSFINMFTYYISHIFEALLTVLVMAVAIVFITIDPTAKSEKEKENESK